jgi:hypothetical protein
MSDATTIQRKERPVSDEVDIENFALRHVTMHDSEKSALSPVVRQRNVLQLECVAPRHRES